MERYLRHSKWIWTGILGSAGISHLIFHDAFVAYYPSYLPLPSEAVYFTAGVEILLAVLLYTKERLAWLGIFLLMIVYLPVHIYVVTDNALIIDPPFKIPLGLAWIRLFLQGAVIAWTGHLALRRKPLT